MTSTKESSEVLNIKNTDKAGEDYWTQVWKNKNLPPPIRLKSHNINEYPNKVLDKIFRKIFSGYDCRGKKILEVGCGNSVFLSYFSKEFGFEVHGIDYSEFGCEQTKSILARDGVKGKIIQADAFNPPDDMLNNYDAVCSFGVAEHFQDTSATLRSFSAFLKPGGILITSVPNFAGVTGVLHKLLNKPVYDIHVPMDKKYLNDAIQKAGLELYLSEYFLSVSFAITLEGIDGKRIPYYILKRVFVKAIRYASKIIWLFESMAGQLPRRRFFSAGIITAAKKPLSA